MLARATTEPTNAAQRVQRSERVARLFQDASRASDTQRQAIQQRIVVEYLELAEAIARRFTGRPQEWGDIRQVAYVGLVKATKRFDQSRGGDFVSFAVPTISGEIKRHLRDNGWFIRPPRRVQELRSVLQAEVPRIAQELGRDPAVIDIATELGESVDNVSEALNCQESLRPVSLDVAVRDGEAITLADTIGAADPDLERAELTETLRSACRSLSQRERRIVYLRFMQEQTQSEIARELGVTQMQVSRLLAKILARLRDELPVQMLAA